MDYRLSPEALQFVQDLAINIGSGSDLVQDLTMAVTKNWAWIEGMELGWVGLGSSGVLTSPMDAR